MLREVQETSKKEAAKEELKDKPQDQSAVQDGIELSAKFPTIPHLISIK